jgi:hypothetical protein
MIRLFGDGVLLAVVADATSIVAVGGLIVGRCPRCHPR